MKIGFDDMKDHSRVWIYTAERELSAEEYELAKKLGDDFVSQWTAHSRDLAAGFEILRSRFVVLAVDETMHGASGCSIDSSVSFIRSLQDKLGISLLNGGKVAVEVEGKIEMLSTSEVKQLSMDGKIAGDNIMFDHLVTDLGSLRERFEVQASNSWLKRFIRQGEAA